VTFKCTSQSWHLLQASSSFYRCWQIRGSVRIIALSLRNLSFLIGACLLGANQAVAADWVYITDSSDGDATYYDGSSIRRYSLDDRDIGEVGAWIKFSHPRGDFVEIKFSIEFDCERYTYREEARIGKYSDGTWSKPIFRDSDATFSIIDDGSIGSILYKYACKN
jgi:hypothetical protein